MTLDLATWQLKAAASLSFASYSMAEQRTLSFDPEPPEKKSRKVILARDEKLKILSFYKENNLYALHLKREVFLLHDRSYSILYGLTPDEAHSIYLRMYAHVQIHY